MAEAGNFAAVQRLYGGPPYGWPPYPSPGGHPGLHNPAAALSGMDLYLRQSGAALLQKPLPFRLYPPGFNLGGLLPPGAPQHPGQQMQMGGHGGPPPPGFASQLMASSFAAAAAAMSANNPHAGSPVAKESETPTSGANSSIVSPSKASPASSASSPLNLSGAALAASAAALSSLYGGRVPVQADNSSRV